MWVTGACTAQAYIIPQWPTRVCACVCTFKTSRFCPCEGCGPVWEAVICWPRANVGETVHRACPAIFSLFKNSTGDQRVSIQAQNRMDWMKRAGHPTHSPKPVLTSGSVSRNCTGAGWSDASPPYHIACSVDEDTSEVRQVTRSGGGGVGRGTYGS